MRCRRPTGIKSSVDLSVAITASARSRRHRDHRELVALVRPPIRHHADATATDPENPPINAAYVQLKPSSVPAAGVMMRDVTTSAPIDAVRCLIRRSRS